MVVEDLLIESTDLVTAIGSIGRWLQAIGAMVVIWIIIQIINGILNRKKIRTLYALKDDLVRIEQKIDKLSKSKK